MRALRFALLALAAFAASGVSAAERVGAGDFAEIRAVIERQLEALRRDDAEQAFALVAPEIQRAYGTPRRYLEVMRTAYAPVTRPVSVAFRDLWLLEGEVVQQLQVTDAAGTVWRVFYPMQRQKDGSWRTAGCQLARQARAIAI